MRRKRLLGSNKSEAKPSKIEVRRFENYRPEAPCLIHRQAGGADIFYSVLTSRQPIAAAKHSQHTGLFLHRRSCLLQ